MHIVVVGGGVIGLLTALECAQAGARVALVDQGDIPCPQATSHDTQRVVRALHRGDPALTAAAARAHLGWLDAERRLGRWFYHRVGAVTAMPAGEVQASLAMLAAAGAPARELPEQELAARYPRIRFGAGLAAVLETTAGIVLADRALTAMARRLRGHPAVRLYPRRRVTDITEPGAVRLADGTVLAADRVIVAAGPWSADLLPAAVSGALTLYRQSVLSYAPAAPGAAWAGLPAMPSLGTGQGAWLIPPAGGAPARLSAASACRAVPQLTDRVTPGYWRDHLVAQFSTLLADFDPAAVTGATDGYYLGCAATGGPLLAACGDGVWAYAACGGMSFKFAPLIARAIAGHALGLPARRSGLAAVDQPRQLAAVAAARLG